MDSGVRSPRVSKGHSHNAQYATFPDRECSSNLPSLTAPPQPGCSSGGPGGGLLTLTARKNSPL